MNTTKDRKTSEGRRGVVAILSSGLTLLVLVFSIGFASTRTETSGQRLSGASRETAAMAARTAAVEESVRTDTQTGVQPQAVWTGRSEEDITQRRLPGHSECDLQLD